MDVIRALLETLVFLALAFAIEFVAPLYRITWASRRLGLQLTLAKTLGVVLILPPMASAWNALGVGSVHLGLLFGSGLLADILAGVLAIVAFDFLSYWNHRFMHRFFWPVHATHHAIRELSALNGYAHFGEKVSEFLLIAIPLSLVQWDTPATPAAIALSTNLLQFWIHSPTTAQLSPLAGVLVTPRFHRVHHSLESRHFDKNFGILFSFWDRLFGTAFIPAANEWPDTGLDGHDEASSTWQYIIHPIAYLRR